jgi:hypothetical protein
MNKKNYPRFKIRKVITKQTKFYKQYEWQLDIEFVSGVRVFLAGFMYYADAVHYKDRLLGITPTFSISI